MQAMLATGVEASCRWNVRIEPRPMARGDHGAAVVMGLRLRVGRCASVIVHV